MNYILFDGPFRNALLPFTYTRPVADIRIGILTIREKWETFLGLTTTTVTEDYLSKKFPMVEFSDNTMINGSYLPTQELVDMLQNLNENEAIFDGEVVVAFRVSDTQETIDFTQFKIHNCPESILSIKNTWDIFQLNGVAIEADFNLITKDKTSQSIPETVKTSNETHIFIEEGANLNH